MFLAFSMALATGQGEVSRCATWSTSRCSSTAACASATSRAAVEAVLQDHRLRRRAARRPRRTRLARAGESTSATGSAAARASSSICLSANDRAKALRVFTTRPDTGFGVTYAVVAPEIHQSLTAEAERANVEEIVHRASTTSEIDRTTPSSEGVGFEKRGAFGAAS